MSPPQAPAFYVLFYVLTVSCCPLPYALAGSPREAFVMPPHLDEKVELAVRLALAGKAVRDAWIDVFYESDDELLNQSLYGNSYARDASSAVGTWMVIASRAPQSADVPALAGPVLDRLALMPPNSS